MGGEAKLERWAAGLARRLATDEKRSMRSTTRSRLRVALAACGFEKRGPSNVRRMEDALAQQGLYADPPLTTPGLDPERIVYFSRTPPSPPGERSLVVPYEFDLQKFIETNFDYLFEGLTLTKGQYVLPSGQKADLVAKDADGTWVVIELKKGRAPREVVSQLDGYLGELRDYWLAKGKPTRVRGIVLAGHDDARLRDQINRLSAASGFDICWMTYCVQMTLTKTRTGHD